MPLIVMEPRGSGEEKDRMKKIEAPPDSLFNLGSKVDCFGLKWLVTKINYNQEIKLSGEMRLCNFPLRWQDDEDFSIIEEWCVVTRYKTSSTGLNEGKVISIDDTRRNILIQYNEHTAKLIQGKRFFIDMEGLNKPKTYVLTDLDRTSYIYNGIGCFQLVCTEDVSVEGDREDLMICDYKDIPDSPTPSIGLCEITYSGESILKVGGSFKRFSVIFKDNDGNTINSIEPNWSIEPEEIAHKIVITSQIGTEIRLTSEDNSLIGKSFVLKVSSEDSIYGFFECEQKVYIAELW